MATKTPTADSLTAAKAAREKALEPNASAAKKTCPPRVDVVITITRKQYVDDATLGTFDARREGAASPTVTGGTLEPKKGSYDLGKGNGVKAYPVSAGTYPNCIVRGEPGQSVTSKNNAVAAPYKRHAVQVVGVPGFGDILLHIGTKPDDTEGCVLLGGATVVTESPIKKGGKVVGTRQTGTITGGTTRQKNWDVLDLIYTVKQENCGEMPKITVIIKDP